MAIRQPEIGCKIRTDSQHHPLFYLVLPTCIAVRAVTHVVADSVVTGRTVLTRVRLAFIRLDVATMAFVAVGTEAVESTEIGGHVELLMLHSRAESNGIDIEIS